MNDAETAGTSAAGANSAEAGATGASAEGTSATGASAEAAGRGETGLVIQNRSNILRMLWIGFYTLLLNLVTLTVFRFWGRTHFRRQLWADTTIGGEPLDYTGRGLELFVGFVIAVFTVMLPVAGLFFAGQLLLGPMAFGGFILVFYLLVFALVGAAIFLARRYHLSRTRYRGIRFAQTGSALAYGLATLGYTLLTGITLGWAGPHARLRLSRMMWSKAYYGSAPIRYEDTPEGMREPVYPSFALAWFGSLFALAVWSGVVVGLNLSPEDAVGSPQEQMRYIAMLYVSFIPLGLVIGAFVAWHEAVMIRRIIKSLHVSGARLSSRISAWDILELAITNTLLLVFTLGIGFMAAQMRTWKRIANRMSLEGEIDFDAIRQNEAEAPKSGEGLADGLDLVSTF